MQHNAQIKGKGSPVGLLRVSISAGPSPDAGGLCCTLHNCDNPFRPPWTREKLPVQGVSPIGPLRMKNAYIPSIIRSSRKGTRTLKEGNADHRKPLSAQGGGPRRSRKRIALVCNGMGPSDNAIRYALNACESLGTGLDLLDFSSAGPGRASLETVLPHLADRGIDFHILAPNGDERKELLRYANETADTLFVVIDGSSWKSITETGALRRSALLPWDSQCPLVVISETTPLTKGSSDATAERPARKAPSSGRRHHETRGGRKPTP